MSSKSPREVPESLRKKGITEVTHNLQPGQEVDWVKSFMWAFREELEGRFLKPIDMANADTDINKEK